MGEGGKVMGSLLMGLLILCVVTIAGGILLSYVFLKKIETSRYITRVTYSDVEERTSYRDMDQ